MAHHDSPTGLSNRVPSGQASDERVSEIRQDEKPLNLLLIDSDNSKPANDTLDHRAGDELLISITRCLQLSLGPNSTAARLGGDESVILQHVSDSTIKGANRLAKRIIRTLSAPSAWGTHTFSISYSIGITITPYQGSNISTLIINVDLAMYASKYHGRGCFHFSEGGIMMKYTHSLFINQRIIDDTGNREFEFHYQPIINLEDESMYGYESLVRWNHPTKGLIYSDYLVNIAKDFGLIVRLGEWIIRQPCEAAAKWPECIRVATSIPAYQSHNPGLVDVIKDALCISQPPAECLEIEITEPEGLDKSIALPVLQEVRSLGIKIAIGDLGTDYAALDYLLIYPFTRVKIACMLVDKLQQDGVSQYLITMLIQFAYKYNMSVTAGGVGTVQRRDTLRDIKCQNAQGYSFSYPLREREMLSVFAKEVIKEGLCSVRLLPPGKAHVDGFCPTNSASNAMLGRPSPADIYAGVNRQ